MHILTVIVEGIDVSLWEVVANIEHHSTGFIFATTKFLGACPHKLGIVASTRDSVSGGTVCAAQDADFTVPIISCAVTAEITWSPRGPVEVLPNTPTRVVVKATMGHGS